MNQDERDRFDALVEAVLDALPAGVVGLLDEAPLIVLDGPTPAMLDDLDMRSGEADELCGLHTGVPATDRSIEADGELPSQIHLFRRGIVALAGGWASPDRVAEQIRITLLHEIGHEFGLDEDDLADLGYD